MNTQQRIEMLEKLDSERSQGDWHAPHLSDDEHPCQCDCVGDEGHLGGICKILVDNGKLVSEGGNDAPPLNEAKANGLFIASAPAMMATIRELKARLELTQKWIEGLDEEPHGDSGVSMAEIVAACDLTQEFKG